MVQYLGEPVKLTQAARKHKIGKARVSYVMKNPYCLVENEDRIMFLGDDHSGRALEVVAIRQEKQWLVLHAMDLREKFRADYEKGKSNE